MDGSPAPALLPPRFQAWFDGRGWSPRRHQLAMVEKGRAGRDALLIAPTGGGKTLAGFLPSLIELSERPPRNTPSGVHTLYLSPLKALAVDVHRNLEIPIADMRLPITVEARTGDTPQAKRVRQRQFPPDMLLTTPEQLALFCAWEGAREYFADLRCVIIDEIHAIHGSKRGDLLSLGLARLSQFAPMMRRVGLSATVNDPDMLRRWLAPQVPDNEAAGLADLVLGDPGAPPVVEVLVSENEVPWSGWTARHAMEEVYRAIQATKTALIFVNTRFQAEVAFQTLWELNDDNLPIALHHGSLAAEQRRKVEAAMSREELRAVVCTSTLDLGIDWGSVDLVIQLAAPKGSSRLVQRIGRANHRLDEPSRALLVPAHRFEFLECEAAKEAVEANDLDGEPARVGAQDILAQHIMGIGCGEPFDLAALYAEVISAAPYAALTWEEFERVVDYVATGGYALRSYDRFARLVKVTSGRDKGRWKARNGEIVARHRMNVGAIIEIPVLSIKVASTRGQKRVGGRKIGEMEESFLEQLSPGDCFLFGGQVWRFETITGLDALVTPAPGQEARTPSWGGSKFALSTYLAKRVRRMIADQPGWPRLPNDIQEWMTIQRLRSKIPSEDEMLVETFQRGKRHFLVAYPFDGRISHGTLCQLLARRLERAGRLPLGFVANDYALAVWALKPMGDLDMAELFQEDMLGDDLEAWLDESFMMKRAFRHCAMLSGLIQRRQPGAERSNRQVTFSTDLIYDVLRKHQPDHLLLRCARSDAAQGVLDVARLGRLLQRIKGRITPVELARVSPFAVPVLLEIGRETVAGAGAEALLQETADELIAEAMELD
jgi:ATP-dependent Lhr-like helicase